MIKKCKKCVNFNAQLQDYWVAVFPRLWWGNFYRDITNGLIMMSKDFRGFSYPTHQIIGRNWTSVIRRFFNELKEYIEKKRLNNQLINHLLKEHRV